MATSHRFTILVAVIALVAIAAIQPWHTTGAATLPGALQAPAPAPSPCPASASWVTAPNPPQEIGGPNVPVGDETNCQFYQFSWQWFLALAQPAAKSPGNRVFETFRVFQPNKNDQCAGPAITGKKAAGKSIFLRVAKPKLSTIQPVTPGELVQATGDALYDQNHNIVFYNVYYSPNECQATSAGFPANTIEIKISWKKLAAEDPSYYMMKADVEGQPMLLGMVGFHLVINTKLHPEFVWATLEHVNNDPDCISPQPRPSTGWSFLSNQCSICISTCKPCNLLKCPGAGCNMNTPNPTPTPPAPVPLTDTPNQVCRVFHDGTDPAPNTGGNNNDTNRFNIDTLNQQIPEGILKQLPPGNPMSVWQNYRMVGGLWTNGGVGSDPSDAQRGSLELSNSTMETFFQDPGNNCFTCHGYTPAPSGNPLLLSHIICALLPQSTTHCSSKLLIQARRQTQNVHKKSKAQPARKE